METLQVIWSYVLPIGGGLTIGAIISAIVVIIVKAFITKMASKIDIEKN